MDTNVIEYGVDGKINYSNHVGDFKYGESTEIVLDSVSILDSTNTGIYKQKYYSDGTITRASIKSYRDSTIEIEIKDLDTVLVSKSYYKKENLIKSTLKYSSRYGGEFTITHYHRKNKHSLKSTVLTTYLNGKQDSVEIKNHGNRKCYKKFEFNESKKEWYLKLILKRTKHKEISCETFYNEFHQMYFTTKKTTVFNDLGLPLSETTIDKYLGQIQKKVIYEYDFY